MYGELPGKYMLFESLFPHFKHSGLLLAGHVWPVYLRGACFISWETYYTALLSGAQKLLNGFSLAFLHEPLLGVSKWFFFFASSEKLCAVLLKKNWKIIIQKLACSFKEETAIWSRLTDPDAPGSEPHRSLTCYMVPSVCVKGAQQGPLNEWGLQQPLKHLRSNVSNLI